MVRILVLGAGQMGTAICTPLADNGHSVELVGTHLDSDIIEELHQSGLHPKLPSHLPDGIQFHHHLKLTEKINEVDLVLLGVNSLGIDWAAQQLGACLPLGLPIVFLNLSGRQECADGASIGTGNFLPRGARFITPRRNH